jgi:acyl-CoA synthetase (AMP-forming)/AMP-acid ligase II
MQKIIIWRGHHGSEILDLIQQSFTSPDNLLILCPPRMEELDSYFPHLPSGTVEFHGELSERKSFQNISKINYPELPSFGLFSSGTTDAKPKLILYTKNNLVSACEGIFSFFKDLKISAVYSYPQPYHIFGLSLGYIAALNFNWELIVATGSYSRAHHEKWIESTLVKGRTLLTLGTPTHFLDALNFVNKNKIRMSSSLTSIAGGAKVEVGLWNKMQKDLKITSPSIGYGCSEASPGVTHLPPGIKPLEDGDLGLVLPEGKLLETENGFEYSGPNVCLAIIQNDEIIFPNGKYLLSDTLSLSPSGHYFFKKRSDLILNRGGEKFSLEEIEAAIQRAFQVNSVAMAIPDDRLGEELGVFIEGMQPEILEEVHKFLNDVFRRNFNKEYFEVIECIPVNANAKFDRKGCLEIMLGLI